MHAQPLRPHTCTTAVPHHATTAAPTCMPPQPPGAPQTARPGAHAARRQPDASRPPGTRGRPEHTCKLTMKLPIPVHYKSFCPEHSLHLLRAQPTSAQSTAYICGHCCRSETDASLQYPCFRKSPTHATRHLSWHASRQPHPDTCTHTQYELCSSLQYSCPCDIACALFFICLTLPVAQRGIPHHCTLLHSCTHTHQRRGHVLWDVCCQRPHCLLCK